MLNSKSINICHEVLDEILATRSPFAKFDCAFDFEKGTTTFRVQHLTEPTIAEEIAVDFSVFLYNEREIPQIVMMICSQCLKSLCERTIIDIRKFIPVLSPNDANKIGWTPKTLIHAANCYKEKRK